MEVRRSEEHTSELQSPCYILFPYTTLFRSQPIRSLSNSDSAAFEAALVLPAAVRASSPVGRWRCGDRKSTRLNSSHLVIYSFPTRRSSDLSQFGVCPTPIPQHLKLLWCFRPLLEQAAPLVDGGA